MLSVSMSLTISWLAYAMYSIWAWNWVRIQIDLKLDKLCALYIFLRWFSIVAIIIFAHFTIQFQCKVNRLKYLISCQLFVSNVHNRGFHDGRSVQSNCTNTHWKKYQHQQHQDICHQIRFIKLSTKLKHGPNTWLLKSTQNETAYFVVRTMQQTNKQTKKRGERSAQSL